MFRTYSGKAAQQGHSGDGSSKHIYFNHNPRLPPPRLMPEPLDFFIERCLRSRDTDFFP